MVWPLLVSVRVIVPAAESLTSTDVKLAPLELVTVSPASAWLSPIASVTKIELAAPASKVRVRSFTPALSALILPLNPIPPVAVTARLAPKVTLPLAVKMPEPRLTVAAFIAIPPVPEVRVRSLLFAVAVYVPATVMAPPPAACCRMVRS